MKKILLSLSVLILFTGCASFHSRYNSIPSSEVYVHRIPKNPVQTQLLVSDEKGIVRQIIPYGEISNNAAKIGNSVANIVNAVRGNFGFPFNIIPELTEVSLKGARNLKEETENQEVYKVNWCSGMNTLDAELADGTKLKINLSDKNKKTIEEGNS